MSDHIGELNEMSDTPISDSTAHNIADLGMLCRTLERLAAVRLDYIKQLETDIERLTQKVAELYAGAEEQKQRNNRLEEAGDYLCAAAAFLGWHDKIETWNKAKEAKP